MYKWLFSAVCFCCALAGCGDKAGPVSLAGTPLTLSELMGIWGGRSQSNSVQIEFLQGKIFPYDSLYLTITLRPDGYSLVYQYVYDDFLNNYSEIGTWEWNELNPGNLSFTVTGVHTLRYKFGGPLVNENFYGDGITPYSSWGSDFEYAEGTLKDLRYYRATLRLFNASGPLDFAVITLTRR